MAYINVIKDDNESEEKKEFYSFKFIAMFSLRGDNEIVFLEMLCSQYGEIGMRED